MNTRTSNPDAKAWAVAWVDPRDWKLFVNIDKDRPHAARKVMLARRQTKLRTLPLYATIGQQAADGLRVPDAESFRLAMGELDTEQVQVAQAAFRMGARAALAAHGKGG